ncbi:MAG: hypothetical protein A2139_07330 [Desulfobacca sp. RBG_16_60_12]|nr:MAG: hypothetical protein A2139_07330 [Desulfobacca sp. RBG_16_60_12]
MTLWCCGVFILGVVLGGLVFLILFSLLAMARKGDEALEQLELAMLRTPKYAPLPMKKAKSENRGVPTTADLYNLYNL